MMSSGRSLSYCSWVAALLLVLLVAAAAHLAQAQLEPPLEFLDLGRLNVSTTTTAAPVAANASSIAGSGPRPASRAGSRAELAQAASTRSTARLETGAAKAPPVYLSAPKQISGLQEIRPMPGSSTLAAPGHETTQGARYEKSAAGFRRNQHPAVPAKPRRPAKAKKPQPRKQQVSRRRHNAKRRSSRKRFVKKAAAAARKPAGARRPRYRAHLKAEEREHKEPAAHPASGYYEYRSVPSKGAWKFGFKRGNDKHAVQRRERGQKSHFRTEVKWSDKEGKGHQLFDYNHAERRHNNKPEAVGPRRRSGTSANRWAKAGAAASKLAVVHRPKQVAANNKAA